MTHRPGPAGTGPTVDHLVYTCPDLVEGVRRVEDLLGVEASPGGRHEGLGTRNALVGLGPEAYLEIVSVDPDQPAPTLPRWFGLDAPGEPRLATWAAKCDRLDEAVRRAGRTGLDLGAVTAAARRRPDGSELHWVFTDPRAERANGIVPFLIDWGSSAHPASGLPAGCTLEGLVAEHPDAERIAAVLEELGIELSLVIGPEPRLIARIQAPNGLVELS